MPLILPAFARLLLGYVPTITQVTHTVGNRWSAHKAVHLLLRGSGFHNRLQSKSKLLHLRRGYLDSLQLLYRPFEHRYLGLRVLEWRSEEHTSELQSLRH